MALLTPAQFREHHETDLGDDALQRLLDDAENEIVRRFGEHVTQTEWLEPGIGNAKLLFLTRRVSAVTSVAETVVEETTALAADDYAVESGFLLRRLSDGTNGRTYWGDRVKVVYTPEDDTPRRKRVQVDLVKLAIQYEGLKASSVGNQRLDMGDYETQRRAVLSALLPPLGVS